MQNINPFQVPFYDELPRCVLRCDDPPKLPEGYEASVDFRALEGSHRSKLLPYITYISIDI